tara:strand:- start:157 stop:5301 length:5145 start_codon:yes stop_codon:yes gene_type:complete
MLTENQMKASLPQRDIQPYNGDPLLFCTFMQAFRYGIENKTMNQMDRLYYLEQLTEGAPNRLVKGMLNRRSSNAYDEAKAMLKQKFGNKFIISEAFKKKAEQWQDIKRDDGKAWCSFAIFLNEYLNTMRDLQFAQDADHSTTIKMLLTKLPYAARHQWRTLVGNTLEQEGIMPGIGEFVDFVDKQSRLVNNPIYGDIGKPSQSTNANNRPRGPYQASFSTGVQEGKPACLHCKDATHVLEECKALQRSTYEDKIAVLKSLRVCYGCLKRGSHLVKDCKKRLSCSICKKRHATVLHCETPPQQQPTKDETPPQQPPSVTTSCGLTGAGALTSVLSVVPVTVESRETGKVVKSYALLDSKSTAVFCSESLRSKLSMQGTKTRLKIQTISGVENVNASKLTGLKVSDVHGNNPIELPEVYVQKSIPINSGDIITKEDLVPWPYLQGIDLPEVSDGSQVELLIGNNVPRALEPIEMIHSHGDGPFASKTILGWEVHGLIKNTTTNLTSVHKITAQDLHQELIDMYDRDYVERKVDDAPQPSIEDSLFMNKAESSVRLKKGHYEIELPFRNDNIKLPNNMIMAENRAAHLKRKFVRNPKFHQAYSEVMRDTLQKGYAEKVPDGEVQPAAGKTWYIPHHGVYHPRKGKLRVVFDCAASYHGVSLNKELLQGPDLTNTLIGVVCRFRKHPIALMADIEAMFNQVKVTQSDRDFLRFLWWPEGDLSKPPSTYRMTTHLFGAKSSPSCCNFALKQTASDNTNCSEKVIYTIRDNFYVDDCLTSVPTPVEAISLIKDLSPVLQSGGFRLTKWGSNDRRVLESVPEEERAKSMKSLDLQESLPVERALGVLWSAETDTFGFSIDVKDHPLTRRGLLSTVCSIYDPLGFAAPVILPGRQILQDLCRLKLGWDDDIPIEQQRKWQEWKADLHKLEEFCINRCLIPEGFENPTAVQIHHFSDASGVGYGSTSYLRLTNANGGVHCILLIAKSRVAPIKKITIPRMELTAATVAVRIDTMLRSELQLSEVESFFWTDSTTVLRYIRNESARYQTFVANRVEVIRERSTPSQWRHVGTAQNPADECSRGQSVEKFLTNQRWTRGPEFLWQEETKWPDQSWLYNHDNDATQLGDDPEVKVSVHAVKVEGFEDPIDKLLQHFSKYHSLKRAVAHLLRLKRVLMQKVNDKETRNTQLEPLPALRRRDHPLTVKDLQDAEEAIIRYVQREAFPKEIETLEASGNINKSSPIYRLDPILEDDILKIGGRLGLGDLPPEAKHPMILPRRSVVSSLILRQIHEQSAHSGRNQILSTLQQRYWIVGANSAARKMMNGCVVCRRQRAKIMEQKMANLPADRIAPDEPPFSKVGMDYFGPLQVKRGRSQVKRYGVVFVCLASKAIHLECAASLDTDACINVIRRFISRRGQVTEIRSDNGSNLVGAKREMQNEIKSWNQTRIHDSLLQKNVDWIFNPPGGSHHGGIWERQIRTIRKLMCATVREQLLTDDNLQTLLCEIEAIVNGRPITRIPGEVSDPEALTPNHLLLLKGNVQLPPAVTEKLSQYARRRWKQVQYLADLFWRRWVREYLPQLNERQKWLQPRRNARVGDLVLVMNESTPRNVWPMGKIIETMPASDGFVRQVRVRTKTSILRRPIDKLCLLLEADIPEKATIANTPEKATKADTQEKATKADIPEKAAIPNDSNEGIIDQAQQRERKASSKQVQTRSGRNIKPAARLDL